MLVDFNKVFYGEHRPEPPDCPCDKCDEPKYFVNNPYYQSKRCNDCKVYKEWKLFNKEKTNA